jgi:hypothetical protein
MATAWVRWPRRQDKGWDPSDPEGRAYLGSLARLAALAEAPVPPPRVTVDTVADLAAGLAPRELGAACPVHDLEST